MVRVARAIAMATKRAMVRVARAMATASKRELTTVARAMATATKRAGAGVARHEGHGRSRYDWRERDDGGTGPWFVCVFLCVWRDHKK